MTQVYRLGGHLQVPVPDWNLVVAKSKPGTWHKVFQLEMATTAKQANPYVKTCFRHHVDNQQPYLFAEDKEQAALDFLARFAAPGDSTWATHAPNIDMVLDLNEYYATGEAEEGRQHKIAWGLALMRVWDDVYRPLWPHIRLGMCNTAVGNDIPLEVAREAAMRGHFLVYHPYMPVKNKERWVGSGTFYDRRHEMMDAYYRINGVYVNWYFGEVGPIGYTEVGDTIALDPWGGWKHPEVCDGDMNALISLMEQQHDEMAAFNALTGGRAHGGAFFTTFPHGWDWFHIENPQLDELLTYFANWSPPDVPPPPDPEPPLSLVYRPCDTDIVTQRFGDNPEDYAEWGLPGHEGIDYHVTEGMPYYAAADGTVVHASDRRWSTDDPSAYGWHVVVDHGDFATVYAHAAPNLMVAIGDTVLAGEILAFSGNTGNSDFHHLHFGLLDQTGQRDPDNGYPVWRYGRPIDPEPYLDGLSEPPSDVGDDPPIDGFDRQRFWAESIATQCLSLNPAAALQAAMFEDGFGPVGNEWWDFDREGTQWALQAGENWEKGERRIYMAKVGEWYKVYWYTL